MVSYSCNCGRRGRHAPSCPVNQPRSGGPARRVCGCDLPCQCKDLIGDNESLCRYCRGGQHLYPSRGGKMVRRQARGNAEQSSPAAPKCSDCGRRPAQRRSGGGHYPRCSECGKKYNNSAAAAPSGRPSDKTPRRPSKPRGGASVLCSCPCVCENRAVRVAGMERLQPCLRCRREHWWRLGTDPPF